MAKLTFLGGVGTVTGSSFLLETGDLKILVDCGMFQGRRELRMRNYRNPLVSPGSLDYILLTHAHIDHSGLIPRFYKQGFQGKILATTATCELCRVMLPDSGHIQEMDAEWESRKARRRGEKTLPPLYTATDALDCLRLFQEIPYGEEVPLNGQVRLRFLDAGHILGSSLIELRVREEGEEMRLVFSGDLGNSGTPILRDPTFITGADYVLIESTYGDRFHPPVADETARLKEIILETVRKKGNVVIPSFAVGRTQELLYELNAMIEKGELPPLPVYIDSPLAVSATEIFRNCRDCYDEATRRLLQSGDDPFSFPGLTFVRTAEESKALNERPGSKIIISASGMCDAGRIRHHLKHNLWRPECAVVFVGFQGDGTLGRRLLDGAKKVRILGEVIRVAARLHSLPGFSAHADQTGLLDWVAHFTTRPRQLFVVHGEAAAAQTLAGLIEQRFAISVKLPQLGETYLLRPGRVELARAAALSPVAADPRQRLASTISRLEQRLAALREQLLINGQENGEEALAEKLVQDLEDKIDEAEQLLNHA